MKKFIFIFLSIFLLAFCGAPAYAKKYDFFINNIVAFYKKL